MKQPRAFDNDPDWAEDSLTKLVHACNYYLKEIDELSAPQAEKVGLIDEWLDDFTEHMRYELKQGLNSLFVDG